MKLGECLDAYRKERKLTWRDLSAEVGVDHAVLFKLTKTTTCGSDNTLRLLNWLLNPKKGK